LHIVEDGAAAGSAKKGDVVFSKWDVIGCYRSLLMFNQGYR